MAFITLQNETPNLCVFCCKSIPPKYHHDPAQNTGTVNSFCASLARLLDCKSITKIGTISSSLSGSSFGSCEDCDAIITQFSSIYHEIKCLELQLFGKLYKLGKVMNLADEVAVSNHGISQPDLKLFRTFRTKLKKTCDDGRKVLAYQPSVSSEIPDQNDEEDENESGDVVSAILQSIPTDVSSEHLCLNANVDQEDKEETINAAGCSTQITITTHPLAFRVKTEEEPNSENFEAEAENDLEDSNPIKVEVSTDTNLFLDEEDIFETEERSDFEDTNMQDDVVKIEVDTNSSLFLDEEENDDCLPSTSNLNRFACKMSNCKRRFNTEEDLIKHKMLDHHSENIRTGKNTVKKAVSCQSFSCQTCGKSFKMRRFLRQHLVFHKNPAEWRFGCSVCGKKFPIKQNLKRHLVVHSEARFFQCKQCDARFKRNDLLKRHTKDVHN